MKRRGFTVLTGAIVAVALFWLLSIAPVPYAEYVPGPTFNTLGEGPNGRDVIEVSGTKVSEPSKGQLLFLTVGVLPNLPMWQALLGWWRSDDAVIPRELVIPPGETQDQVDRTNKADFSTSQSAASAAADIALGHPLKVSVTQVAPGLPADGKLRVGDVVDSVDGQAIDAAERLMQVVRSKELGSTLSFTVTRAGTTVTVPIKTVADDQGQPRIGVALDEKSTAPYTFSVPIENVGGPSAGLMLTLGMIDKIRPEDLTGGRIIAGTGTIDSLGAVGPIGGIQQKIIAAKGAGAQYFLTPSDNCAEAVGAQAPGMPLVRVATLNDALAALDDIRANKTPSLCPGAAG